MSADDRRLRFPPPFFPHPARPDGAAGCASLPPLMSRGAPFVGDLTTQADEDTSGRGPAEERPYITVGMVGEPNMGKSAIINRLFGAPMVGVSPTPGRTKHLQTHFLGPKVGPPRIIDQRRVKHARDVDIHERLDACVAFFWMDPMDVSTVQRPSGSAS